jgi:hypothetical protein
MTYLVPTAFERRLAADNFDANGRHKASLVLVNGLVCR